MLPPPQQGNMLIAPLLFFHARFPDYTQADFSPKKFALNSQANIFLGYRALDVSSPGPALRTAVDYSEGDYQTNWQTLGTIIELAQSYDCKVLLVLIPNRFGSYSTLSQRIREDIKRDYPRKGVAFEDFNTDEVFTSVPINPESDFVDTMHLNWLGAERFSRYFARYIQTKYPHLKENIPQSLAKEETWSKTYSQYRLWKKQHPLR